VRLPDLSYMMTVAGLRYIQSVYEPRDRRNPDNMVRELLTPWQRLNCDLRARIAMDTLRGRPFYYYVLARTHYYDDVYRTAVANGAQRIVNIGAGSDTRAYRFAEELKKNRVQVLECDQPEATMMKQRAARRRWRPDHVSYLPIDLNDATWPDFQHWLRQDGNTKTLVLMEGVSPYIESGSFGRFLQFLAGALPENSWVAYDFKLPGVNEVFVSSERIANQFRLASGRDEVVAHHTARGYRVERLETSAELTRRLAPFVDSQTTPLFEEDALVQLSTRRLGAPSLGGAAPV
jgi:methyltransferase (TIGR00027 family)